MTITSPSTVPTGSIYTDNSGLQQIKAQSEANPKAALRQAAQQFEAIFVQMMMKSMRAAKLADGAMDSDATRFYEDLYDKQMGLALSGQSDGNLQQPSRLGIADMLMRQLGGADGAITPPAATSQAVAATQADTLVGIAPVAPAPATSPLAQSATPAGVDGLLAGQNPFTPAPADASRAHALAALKRFAPEFGLGNVALPDAAAVSPADLETGPAPSQVSASKPSAAGRSGLAAGTNTGPGVDRFASPEHFVSSLWDAAAGAASKLGVEPQVLLAQAALETGWGKHMPRHTDGSTSHNLFGIKATRRWHGDRVQQMTSEFENGRYERRADGFRAYDSFAASFDDYVNLLTQSSRYRRAVSSTENPARFYSELQRAGYATDPNYANKLGKLLASDTMRDAVASRAMAAGPTGTNRHAAG